MDQKSDIKNNFLKKLNYKLKYNSLRKILETNKKWFKNILVSILINNFNNQNILRNQFIAR